MKDKIRRGIDRLGGQSVVARLSGVSQPTVSRIYHGKSCNLDNFLAVLKVIGGEVRLDDERGKNLTRDVCFVQNMSVQADKMALPPESENYIAVPLAAGEVAAGRGMIPDDRIRTWVLAWKNHDSVRFRTNLVAVEVGDRQTSMVPTLHPRDILLVDRDDFRDRFDPPGNIFLVREPDDSVTVKRVAIKQRDGDITFLFYSDNAMEHPPITWSLNQDYGGDISRAVIGRVVWAWSDMSRK